jgi:hypothetical protein
MPRLTDERGSVSVIVTMLLITGVMLGMAALVVDGGRLYVERAELQRAADAAVLALAQECASNSARCTDEALASAFANANAEDQAHAIAIICGTGGPGLQECMDETTQSLCTIKGKRHVAVRTSTLSLDGSNLVAPVFGRVLMGDGYDGTTVGACSVAAWGVPGNFDLRIGLAINANCWEALPLAAPGPYDAAGLLTAAQTSEMSIRLQFGGVTDPVCAGTPGGFSLIDQQSEAPYECQPIIRSGDLVTVLTRVTIGQACSDYLVAARGTVVPIAIYDPGFTEDTGTRTAQLRVKGFAAFYVSGFRIPGSETMQGANPVLPGNTCTGSDRFCLYGWFTYKALISPADVFFGDGDGEGTDFGLRVVRLVG